MYACHDTRHIEHSRAKLRDCAAGHVGEEGDIEPCGLITVLGWCEDFCTGFSSAEGYYSSCFEDPSNEATDRVITTALLP